VADVSIQGNGEARWERALALYRDGYFERIAAGKFIVASPKGGEYEVDLGRRFCHCEDFRHHQHHEAFVCKHLIAVRMYQGWVRKNAIELAPLFGSAA
jgi:predicted nucleic acid-binding Zn finger protein